MRVWTAFCGLWLMWLSSCNADEPRIICQYDSSAADKVGYERLRSSEIDPSLCTHLIALDLGITGDGLLNPWTDFPNEADKAGFQELSSLRNRNEKLKILVSTSERSGISSSDYYSKISADASLRSRLVKNVVDFVLRYEFDGICWEYPTANAAGLGDVQNFVSLLKEFRPSFDQHKLILSAKVRGSETDAKMYYDIPQISKYLDLIMLNIIFDTSLGRIADHSTPLYPAARKMSSNDRSRNINASIHYWLDQGAPAEKLILGIQSYGQSYVLKNSAEYEPGSPAIGRRHYLMDEKLIGYSKICRLITQQNWTTVWDEEQRVPYSYKGNQWITYDNEKSLTEKGEYVKATGLGGVVVWNIERDEHRGDCGERFPLLNALNRKLRENGTRPVTTRKASSSTGDKIFCYYERYAAQRFGYEGMSALEIDPNLCTHLVYLSVVITRECDINPDPSRALPDIWGKTAFQKFNASQMRGKGLKTFVSISDYDQMYPAFSEYSGDTELQSKCVKNIVDFVLRHEFDGFELQWQFPRKAPETVKNFVFLLKELRASLDHHGLILIMAGADLETNAKSYYNISEITSFADYVTLGAMYHRSTDPNIGHLAPLYPAARETSSWDRSLNINASVHHWLSHGVPAEKLLLVARFSGLRYVLNTSTKHGPGSPANYLNTFLAGSDPLAYNEICLLTAQHRWSTVWDEEQRIPYSYKGTKWISYNNIRSLTEMGEYAKAMGLAGVAAWNIEMDDHWGECGESYPLLNALNCALRERGCSSVSSTGVLPSAEANVTAEVFCYYQSWSLSKSADVSMEISDIDPILCTHLVYGFVGITEDGDVQVLDPWADLPDNNGKAGFQKFNALRKRNGKLKTLVSTGGGIQASGKYSEVAADASLRSEYVRNVVDFVLRHEFDGFNIFWQYPNEHGRSTADVENFVLLLKELRSSFDEHKLILTAQLEGVENYARSYYDVPGISKHVDFILLSTGYHDPRDSVTGHSAPLFHAARETSSSDLILNVNATIHFWLSEGAPAKKLILGTRLYGMGYVLDNLLENRPGSSVRAPTQSDPSPWYLDYIEICKLITQEAWTTVWDEEQRVPYSYAGNQWITYDDVRSLTEKGKYARDMGLGGVMAVTVDQDDHRGRCGEQFPLLNALNRGLRGDDVGPDSAWKVPTSREVSIRMKSGSVLPSTEAKIICYYKTRTLSRNGYANLNSSEIDPNLCTHLIYAYIGITRNGDVRVLDPWSDLDDNKGQRGFKKLNDLREKNKKLKTLVSCGGEDEGSLAYSKVAADASLRSKFAENVVDFLTRHGFDGLDVSWQYPNDEIRDLKDAQNFVPLLKELRERFDKNDLILCTKVEGSESSIPYDYDTLQISKYVDFIVLEISSHHYMESTTGHIAPLFPSTREISSSDRIRNYHSSVRYWLREGVPAEKLILGTKFYGMSFVLASPAEHVPGSPVDQSLGPVLGSGYLEYNILCKLISQDGWTAVWDEEQHASYSYAGNRWISYDNVRSMEEKAKYVQAMGLGGIMAFSVDMDDHRGECGERYPLLKTLNRVLRETSSGSGSTSAIATNSRPDAFEDEDARRTCAKVVIKYVRHPRHCAKFWICLKIKDNEFHAEPFSCGKGLHFDTTQNRCKSKDVVDCS